MKNLNDMDRNDAELIEASDAELEQISGGVFRETNPGMVLKNLLFRQDEEEDSDIVLLPMQTTPGVTGKKKRKKNNLGKTIKL